MPGRGHSSPIVWRRSHLSHDVDRGRQRRLTITKRPIHLGFDLKPGYYHADSVGVDYLYTLKVLAFDAKGGKLLWEKTVYDGVMYDNRHSKNTYASSTMVTDGSSVYAFFESGGLYAFDFDGKLAVEEVARRHCQGRHGPGNVAGALREPGRSCSAIRRWATGSFIVALDRKDGQGGLAAGDGRPGAAGRRRCIVQHGGASRDGDVGRRGRHRLRSATGKELWRANGTESHPIPSPVAGDGLVFLTAGSPAKRAMAIKPGGDGDLDRLTGVVWRYDKGTAYVPSPILRRPVPLPDDRQRHHHVPRRGDRQGRLRRRPPAGAGDVHGVAVAFGDTSARRAKTATRS